MIYQRTDYDCGPTALANALRCYGYTVDCDLARLCKTDPEGTDESGLKFAIKVLLFACSEINTNIHRDAYRWLNRELKLGRPCILSVEDHDHWVTVIGKLGDRYVVAEPTPSPEVVYENGILVLTHTDLDKLWKNVKQADDNRYYGIGVY